MTVSSLAVSAPKYKNFVSATMDAPKPARTDGWLDGKYKHDAKMPFTACYTDAQRQGWLDAYNRRGQDLFLRCCEAEGVPADVAMDGGF